MTKDEALAMDLALEYLKLQKRYGPAIAYGNTTIDECIAAIKKVRVAEFVADFTEQPAPVQEPVATLWQHGETGRTRITMPGDITDCDARWFKAADLYTTPPAAQRQWVGLTDEELELLNDCGDTDSYKFARAIEAKLKEKNT